MMQKGKKMSEVYHTDNVVCIKCGNSKVVIRGHLTEEGKKNFVCYPCAFSDTVEGRVDARREDEEDLQRRLLVEV
jgi:hypothetical protein